jgi:hypothetical protein
MSPGTSTSQNSRPCPRGHCCVFSCAIMEAHYPKPRSVRLMREGSQMPRLSPTISCTNLPPRSENMTLLVVNLETWRTAPSFSWIAGETVQRKTAHDLNRGMTHLSDALQPEPMRGRPTLMTRACSTRRRVGSPGDFAWQSCGGMPKT